MAQALEKTPYEPAYDLYSALQGMWILHMIASCYVGSRDYAFGRFDQYLLPFYGQALKDGAREEELVELVAGFLIKTNEICGRTAHDHQCKPVLCHSSKQYVNIGGETPNAFSQVVLRAAMLSNMAQPQITVLLKPEADVEFTRLVFEAMSGLVDKLHIYHYDLVVDMLKKKGIEDAVARDFTYSACCTFDLNYHSYRLDHFIPAPQLFLQTLAEQDYASLTELTSAFREMLKNNMQKRMRDEEAIFANRKYARQIFVFDSLFLTDSAFECQYACEGRGKYVVFNMFFAGIATLGDSLMVLDRLVFREKRYTCREFVEILNQNFQGHEALRREILAYDKFGNDTEVDEYAALMGNVFLDAVDQLELRKNQYVIGGFYSLERDNTWRAEVGATPDGRLAGEPFSENQSPTYGADKAGFTALLKSLSRLPFQRTATGGLNLTFSQRMTPSILQSLVTAYFQMGGLHVGISVVDHDTLRDAMDHPEKYRSLTVRLYGFSEYFVSLPKFQQLAILHRTTYAG